MAVLRVAALAFVLGCVLAVDRSNFKTCEESSFCKRNRALPKNQSPWSVDASTLTSTATSISVDLKSSTEPGAALVLKVTALKGNVARVYINDKTPKVPRHEVQGVIENHEEVPVHVSQEEGTIKLQLGGDNAVVIGLNPFRLHFVHKNSVVMAANNEGLLNFERNREKAADENWSEEYKSHADTRPNGPSSVGIDITFFDSEHVYGIPEHASTYALKSTKNTDPYRLYNLDVFEYELDNPMALYGSIPYMVSHAKDRTAGMLFLNAAEMWIDIHSSTDTDNAGVIGHLRNLFGNKANEKPETHTHWMAESGVIDLYFLLGPQPEDVSLQYAQLTGFPAMPPLFALGYHQCRWNYNDQDDVHFVATSLDEHDMPFDVIWLDIEHTDGKKYFTYDTAKFNDPVAMQNELAITGRRMVNIVDPHIKRDSGYHIHTKASELGHYIKNRDGGEYDGWCWPGSSSWLDFLDPKIQLWWADQFALDKYQGTTPNLFVWNDMNEPSVFNGPEVTMHKDAKHHNGFEHRDVHNIYGMWNHAATSQGLIRRSGGVERPFVLSRAFFAGTQKYGAIWTGDNKADWGHLAASVPMLLSIGTAGLPFAGADMGGFFGNPEKELLVRWYQVGAFQPFMRAHAHLDTKRREPYLLDEPERSYVRWAIKKRYVYLPYVYTLFHEASTTGLPVMRPLWMEFPEESAHFAEERNFMLGGALLVAPVVQYQHVSSQVTFPGTQPWYDIDTYQAYTAPQTTTVDAPLSKIPVFQRGGTIIPTKARVRRSSSLGHNDPFTLQVALDSKGAAAGSLFIDDYHSFGYASGKYMALQFTVTRKGSAYIFAASHVGPAGFQTKEWIERVRFLGFSGTPKSVTSTAGAALDFHVLDNQNVLDIKKPATTLAGDFAFTVEL
eukprot:m.234252 g.234252  ORF g.234252 m.234252 type:complete len:895 (-) comp12637_c0_seq1:37-2721(-)